MNRTRSFCTFVYCYRSIGRILRVWPFAEPATEIRSYLCPSTLLRVVPDHAQTYYLSRRVRRSVCLLADARRCTLYSTFLGADSSRNCLLNVGRLVTECSTDYEGTFYLYLRNNSILFCTPNQCSAVSWHDLRNILHGILARNKNTIVRVTLNCPVNHHFVIAYL